MDLDEFGYFDGGRFIFHQPFPFISREGVTLLGELDYRRMKDRNGIDLETLVELVLKQQVGVDHPLRQGKPDQKTPKKDPGE